MDIALGKKLNYLSETKDLIKTALIEKGQAVTDSDTFRSYADKVLAIQSGGTLVSASGHFEPTSNAAITVQHNMGVKPDIVVIYATVMPTTNMAVVITCGISNTLRDKGITMTDISKAVVYSTAAGSAMTLGVGVTMDEPGSMHTTYGLPRNPTTTEFTVNGGTTGNLQTGTRYDWFAIGGLT